MVCSKGLHLPKHLLLKLLKKQFCIYTIAIYVQLFKITVCIQNCYLKDCLNSDVNKDYITTSIQSSKACTHTYIYRNCICIMKVTTILINQLVIVEKEELCTHKKIIFTSIYIIHKTKYIDCSFIVIPISLNVISPQVMLLIVYH